MWQLGRRHSRFALAVVLGLAWLAATSPAAHGIWLCTYNPFTLTLTVVDPAVDPLDDLVLAVSDGTITVNGQPCAARGQVATVFNTDLIVVNTLRSGINVVRIHLAGGAFAPGATQEGPPSPDPISEIEFLLTGGVFAVQASGGAGTDNLAAGSGGPAQAIGGVPGVNDVPIVNLNAFPSVSLPIPAPVADLDGDVFLDADAELYSLTLVGGDGADRLLASGGAGTGPATDFGPEATGSEVFLHAGGGNDTITGGNGDDRIVGGTGNDLIIGGADHGATPCDPNSTLFDESGDSLDYDFLKLGPVQVDLETPLFGLGIATGAQGVDVIVGMESVFGSPSNDILVGAAGPNKLRGFNGNDTILGESGSDCIFGDAGGDGINGGAGNDQLFADDNVIDFVAGGPGSDQADVDQAGDGSPVVDLVQAVETVF